MIEYMLKLVVSNLFWALVMSLVVIVVGNILTGGDFDANFWEASRTMFLVFVVLDVLRDLYRLGNKGSKW